MESCSQALHRPDCHNAVHTVCGIQVAGCEGYGTPVWCRSCYLNEREDAIQHSRATAKRGQNKQILRMEKQSVKKARVLDIGDNILIPTPVVDKRSPFDPPNLAGVITGTSQDKYYKMVRHQERLRGGIYLQRLNFLSQNFFCLEMYLILLSHSDKQSFPLHSERTDYTVAAPVDVALTDANVDVLRKFAILSAIRN